MKRIVAFHHPFYKFDGQLAPKPEVPQNFYVAKFWRIPALDYSAFSFWDRTIDQRGACNSIFFVPGVIVTHENMIKLAKEFFPEVWARMPPVTLLDGFTEHAPDP